MKYILLTVALGLASCSQTGGDATAGNEHYDPSRPPLKAGQFPFVLHAYCCHTKHQSDLVNIWVFDSAGAPLPQFTFKALKKPYGVLSNIGYFSTDQNGEAKVSYKDCDSVELANLSFLTKKACRVSAENLPDTIIITLSLSQEKFIESTM